MIILLVVVIAVIILGSMIDYAKKQNDIAVNKVIEEIRKFKTDG
jgi:hypothetical protein